MSLLPFGRRRYEERQQRREALADAYRTGITHGRQIERSAQTEAKRVDEELTARLVEEAATYTAAKWAAQVIDGFEGLLAGELPPGWDDGPQNIHGGDDG